MSAPARSGTATKLYTPDLLALAVSLADYPLHDGLALRGAARSKTCGSSLEMGIAPDPERRIGDVGLAVSACAVGQAAAAIFAAGCAGQGLPAIEKSLHELTDWLDGASSAPDWPGIQALNAARAHPGRHGAILLPWKAAMQALSMAPAPR